MEAQYGKFLDMIRAVRINVPLVNVLAGMPNSGKILKELISNKHKIKQISVAFLSDESSTMIQNKVLPKLGDPGSFLIPCYFNKTFLCNALANLGASINLMPYSLYAKLSLETLKPTKMSVRLADRSFQDPVGIAKNMLVKVGKFTFPADFVILKMEEDSKVPLILGRPFLHTADAVIRVKQKQLNLGVRTERMIFNIDSAIKYSYSNDDTCFSIDVIDEILEEDFDALLDEGSKILYSIEGTILEEEIFSEFDKFIAMASNENYDSKFDEEGHAVGAIFGQKDGKNFHPIYFASKTLNPTQQKYTITEKELIAVVFAFNKFRSDLILSKTIVHTDHSALRHLFKKQDAKPSLIRWIILLQEFDIEIKDKKGTENVFADHLSRIDNHETSNDSKVEDNFPRETLMEINTKDEPWFADFINYLVGDIIPKG
ncbi:reverse transcriptase domain-containing protein [Tanacetum coccineum]